MDVWLDNADRLTTVTSPYGIGSQYNTVIAYNNDDTCNTLTAQNGAVTTYLYDLNARPTSITTENTSATVLQSSAYTYDDAGNVEYKSIFGGGSTTPTILYQYDGADELTLDSMPTTSSAYPNAYTYRYNYDHNANRLTKDWGTGTIDSYTYDPHDKMTAVGAQSFTYDANGNMTGVTGGAMPGWSSTYDCQNRMLTSAESTGGTDTNTYNGLGCRVMNHDFAGTYTNITDGVSATSSVLYNGVQIYTPGFSSEERGAGGYNYYTEPDQIGSSLGMMNTSQSQMYGVEYDAFGDIVGTDGTFPDSYAFMDGYAGTQGYQTDRDTGFIRCGNRYFSPYFGRFITQDPAGQGSNWYAYCGNDPTGRTDANGLDFGGKISDPTQMGNPQYWLDPFPGLGTMEQVIENDIKAGYCIIIGAQITVTGSAGGMNSSGSIGVVQGSNGQGEVYTSKSFGAATGLEVSIGAEYVAGFGLFDGFNGGGNYLSGETYGYDYDLNFNDSYDGTGLHPQNETTS